ncbi:UbiA family prenyltransferase [Candidatus Woesebacteria bacterium]|nr:UbiA family prenyltransferase [Candidatus Woesebacteria bacterium]QQG47004.1 MAG: UbiA family prenyltransferase [Candidatus Woesebacteria bacterium]
MLKKITNFLLTEIIYNGHLQALGAVGIVYVSTVIAFGKNPSFISLFIIYLVFQFIYFFDRFRDIRKDKLTNKERSAHIEKYLKKIPFIMGIILFLVITLTLSVSNVYSLVSEITVMFLGAMYPIYFKGLTKKIPMFKNFYVGSVHALLVFFPIVFYNITPIKTLFLFILFLYVLSEAIIFQIALDMKDIEGDKKDKLLTLPVLIGFKSSLNTINILNIASFIMFLAVQFIFKLNPILYLLIFSNLVINFQISNLIRNKKKSGYILSASKFFLWLCLSVVANIIV